MADTIVALSSGALPSAIAIVRISGPMAFAAARLIAGSLPPPREARLRRLTIDGNLLDRAVVLTFEGPATATGEDLVELHLHGGVAVVDAVIAALKRYPGVIDAEPGAFTRRALSNGRVELTQVEGLAALLNAQTEAQRRVAIQAADGALQQVVLRVEAQLLELSALAELLIEFADEDDAADEEASASRLAGMIDRLVAQLDAWIVEPTVDSLLRGFRVVLAGEPNSGKSTLLNRLAGREVAIVSDIPGTTRDRIEVPVQHSGVAFVLTDTAGLRDTTSDTIETIGIDRARAAIEAADIILWLGAGDAPRPDAVLVQSRIDLPERQIGATGRIGVSAATGEGIEHLWAALHTHAAALTPSEGASALNDRQRRCLIDVRNALIDANSLQDPIVQAHLIAEARSAIHRLTGQADTEAMLDGLFGQFCIGK